MGKLIRCQRCFAPKEQEMDVCEFCDLDPMMLIEENEEIVERPREDMTLAEEIEFFTSQFRRRKYTG